VLAFNETAICPFAKLFQISVLNAKS